MAVTPHTNQIDEVFTLAIGNQTLSSLLATPYPGLSLGFAEFAWGVASGGPVAIAKKTMSAITDGMQKTNAQAPTDGVIMARRGVIDGTKINFFATANGDKIWIRASTR